MPSAAGPDLKKYMNKRLQIKLNGNRTVTGVLRGFDQFMNLVLDETMEIVRGAPERVACRHFIFAVPPYSRACAFSCVLFLFSAGLGERAEQGGDGRHSRQFGRDD